MKDYYDLKRLKGPILEEGGKVYLLRRNIRLKRPYEKLDFKKYGPYRIEKNFLDLVYKLKLLKGSRQHLVFYISLLKLILTNIPLQSIAEQDESDEFEVKEILNLKELDEGIKYLVKWKNYSPEDHSQEPPKNFVDLRLLQQFYRQNLD